MVFSLSRRFSLFLLAPVAVTLIAVGLSGFFYARSLLLDQWVESTSLMLEKAAVEIQRSLHDKIELIELIAEAESIPRGNLGQTFLIQELIAKDGVKFADVVMEGNTISEPFSSASDRSIEVVRGLYTMELCGDFGFCAPTMDPHALDRSLRIVKTLRTENDKPVERLVVRISFDSFMRPIEQMRLWQASSAQLVTTLGQFLAHTDPAGAQRRVLGETGDPLEVTLLEKMRHSGFGTVFGSGHPPDMVIAFQKIPTVNWYLVVRAQGAEILRPLVQFRFSYTVAAFGVIAMVLLLIRLSTGSVARCVARISEVASRVEGGDYSQRLPEIRSDELGTLNRSFNSMIDGLAQREDIRKTFGRFIGEGVAAELMKRPRSFRLGGDRHVVTMLMAELRQFMNVTEQLDPQEVIRFLNNYFAVMIDIVEDHHGIIVDFYFDSMLVFFMGVAGQESTGAEEAVQCGLAMQQAMSEFQIHNHIKQARSLALAIGIHTGPVVVGNVGSETRAKYGVVGSNVNLTARIKASASGGRVVISEETRANLSDKVRISTEFSVCLKGLEGDRNLFEVESVGDGHMAQ